MIAPKVKICGITRMSDVRVINGLGVDFVGFIFYRHSPRFVSIRTAKTLSAALDPLIQPVGVFVEERVDKIIRTCRSIRATVAQVHGQISESDIRRIQLSGLRVARAFHVRRRSDWRIVNQSTADIRLVDNSAPGQPGGVGVPFDWSAAPGRRVRNLMLAGGLDRVNYFEGARLFRPVILDFNSGVERSPGVKHRGLLRDLMTNIQTQDWDSL